jgi:hypothetical protein
MIWTRRASEPRYPARSAFSSGITIKPREIDMAKGEQRGNREAKKSKKEKINVIAAAPSQKTGGWFNQATNPERGSLALSQCSDLEADFLFHIAEHLSRRTAPKLLGECSAPRQLRFQFGLFQLGSH